MAHATLPLSGRRSRLSLSSSLCVYVFSCFFFFSSRRRHTRFDCDWSSDVCSSDLLAAAVGGDVPATIGGQNLTIREWQGPVGQWDSRLKEPRQLREVSVSPMTQIGRASCRERV